MGRVRHILVAVDQFPQSKIALARAVELARAHTARLTIVHIAGEFGAQCLDVTERHLVEEQALTSARKRIEDAIRAYDLDPIAVDIRVEVGSPSSRIVEISNDLDVDLIVLRAHQRLSILEKVIGSTADRIIRATPASVLIVKRPVERDYRNAVIAIDFSKGSESAAVQSAELCPGVRLQLVHVMYMSKQFEQVLLRVGTRQAKIAAFRRRLVNQAREKMRGLATRFEGREPALRTRVIEGEPAKSLVRLTWNPRVDLIAVGPYGRDGIRLALLGSVTQRLLREAACDVLISRTPPATV